MSIHETIKRQREAKKWSMEDLATRVSQAEGLAKPLAWQTVQQWEKGTAPKRKRLEVVASLFGMSVAELLGEATVAVTDDPDFVAVRRVDVRFSNGIGQVVYEEDDKPPLVFRSGFLRRAGIAPGDAVVIEAAGISNEPRIMDGSVVLLNRGDREHLDGDFFAFRFDGELLIKRLERIPEVGILATAENPLFRPKQKVYMNADEFEIIGRAVWTGAML